MQVVNSTLSAKTAKLSSNVNSIKGEATFVAKNQVNDSRLAQTRGAQQKPHSTELVLSSEAIAYIEQQAQLPQRLEPLHQNKSQTNRLNEPLSLKHLTAVNQYQAIDNLAQRESVQQMLGVDLFA